MRKIYYLLTLFLFSSLIGKSQCAIDSNNTNIGFWPPDTSLPVINQGFAYDTAIQFYLPAFVNDTTDTLQIRSLLLDTANGITGFPTGITYVENPASNVVSPNSFFCVEITGTTNDTFGVYNLHFNGSIHVISAALGDTVLPDLRSFNAVLQSEYVMAPVFQYALVVQGKYVAPCNYLTDTSVLSGQGVYPVPSDLPCIVRDSMYNQTVVGRIQVDSSVSLAGLVTALITVDSLDLDSIAGLPTGITFGRSPAILYGGDAGCVNFTGTTTDSVGTYALSAYGTVWITGSAVGQTFHRTLSGNLNSYSSFGGYYLRVVNTSDSCTLTIPTGPSGINNYFKNLNAEISVYPNPNNGVFELNINAASPVTGQILVYDAIGREVYQQPVNVSGIYSTSLNLGEFGSGLYFVQVRTPQGSALKKISVE